MVGKNNKKLLMEMGANKFKRYTLKKLSIGVASVSIGIGLMFGATEQVSAQAEAGTVIEHDEPVNQDITPQSEQQEPEIDHVLEAKRQEVNAYLASSNLQHNRDQFKAQIDQATSVSELVNIENQINEAVAEQVEETEKNNQLSEEEQEQKPQDTQVSDEKQLEELEKKRKAVKDELGKSEIVIWDDYLALLNKINEATSIEELDAISAEIRGDKAPEKQDEKEQEADNTIEQSAPATPQQPQVDVQQDTSKPEVEYTLDQVRHFFNQEEIAKIEAGQITIKQALQKALGTQPDIKTNQNHHEENVLAAGVENLDNKQEEQTGKRRTRRNTGNVDLNRVFDKSENFMDIIAYIDSLIRNNYITLEEGIMAKRAALRQYGNQQNSADLRNDANNKNKWERFISGDIGAFNRDAMRVLTESFQDNIKRSPGDRKRVEEFNKMNWLIEKIQFIIKNRSKTSSQQLESKALDGDSRQAKSIGFDFSSHNIKGPDQSRDNRYQVDLKMSANFNNNQKGKQLVYDVYTLQVSKSLDKKIVGKNLANWRTFISVKEEDGSEAKGSLERYELRDGNGNEVVQYVFRRNYVYGTDNRAVGRKIGDRLTMSMSTDSPIDTSDSMITFYTVDTINPQLYVDNSRGLNTVGVVPKDQQSTVNIISKKMKEIAIEKNINEARDKVKAAEAKQREAQQKLADVTGDQLVTPSERQAVEEANKQVAEAKEAAETALANVPDGTPGKEELAGRLANVGPVTPPEVNDRDEDGTADDEELSTAQRAVEAAEAKQREAQQKLADVTGDQLVTPSERQAVEEANKQVAEAKEAAETALANVPDGTPGKEELAGRLANVGPVTPPEVNDRDEDGTADDEELSTAQRAVEAAEAKQREAQQKLADVTGDQLVTPSERQAVEEANKQVAEAKEAAETALANVPDGTPGKEELAGRLANVGPVTPPEVNDRDEDGTADDEELSTAQRAVEAAEAKQREAQQKLADVTGDQLVTPSERQAVEEANKQVAEAKEAAETALANVPDGTPGKEELAGRLANVGPVTPPEVNDRDEDGTADDEELSTAQRAVEAAEAKQREAQQKLADVTGDQLVTPSERQAVEEANKQVAEAKEAAETALANVPDGTPGKEELAGRLANVGPVTPPEVNDRDEDGTADDEELSTAQRAVEAAEAKQREAQQKLADVTGDQLVTPSERQAVEEANKQVAEAKEAAETALANVPDGTPGKEELAGRLANVGPVTPPEVNDRDEDGTADDEELSTAQRAVEAAEAKQREAQQKLADVTGDQLVTPSERQAVEEANKQVAEAKEAAETALANVPDGTPGKEELAGRLANVGPVTPPEVNDRDEDGTADDEELSTAQRAVEAAEAKQREAQQKLADVTGDQLVTPSERQAVEEANKQVAEAKEAAETALANVPDGTPGKEELAGRLANVGPVTPPEVNDRDEDGTADDEELSTAQRAVEAAEAKQREAQQKLADVTGDQLVTPSERQAVEEANKQVAEAKEAAETALANVPDGTPGKEELAGRLANVGPVTPPEVNDRDEDGTADDEELSTAQRAVEAAEAKQREAQQKLADVTGDQLVTPSERQAVEEANKQVAEAKEAAETALANVPDGTPGKEELAGRLANVGPVTPPEVNDRDEDGTADDEELSTAQRAVEAAEAKQREAQQKLADVTGDQLVTPSERQAVEEANKQVAEAKEAAETALANVPDGTPGKEELAGRLANVGPVTPPEVNDRDEDGTADDEELSTAQRAVEAAEAKQREAQQKLADVTGDQLVTPSERQAVEEANKQVAEAKEAAETALANVPDGTPGKEELAGRLANVGPVTPPEVNDRDEDGTADDEELSTAQRAVEAAEAKQREAQQKLADVTGDQLVTPSERQAVEEANKQVAEAKEAAETALANVPDGTPGKEELAGRLANVGPVTPPEVNDRDEDGTADDEELSTAQRAVEAAEAKQREAQQKLADVTGDQLVTPSERQAVEEANKQVAEAKEAAETALANVPDGTPGKEELAGRLANVGPVTPPEVNDRDEDGTADDEELSTAQRAVEAAEAKQREAQQKLADVTGDQLVTPSERQAVEEANKQVAEAKEAAETALANVPDGTPGKEELAGRLANVGPVTPPEVNDRDEDGTADDEELSTAQRAVEAAEAKQREAQQKLADVTGDQLVTPSERQAVEEANKQVAEAKEAAETALANVPDGTPGKEELAGRLANVGPVTPPEVNDRDEDGTADDEELSTAQRAVEAAEAKQREAQQKLADVTGDQLVTPSERQAVEEANKQVAEAKEAAETALANVPDGTPGKEELAGRLANVGPVTPPEVNDRDEDGTADDEELSTAQRAVEAAEAKQREAQQKLADVTGDQLVTPSERQAVEEANKQVAEAKEAAETALANVPDGTPGKEELAGRLANVGPVTPPEVNDRDEDGTADDEELSTAQRAVEAAEAKQREAQQKLADVTGDQLVTPSERQAVEEANKQVAEAKEAAETALANVPDGTPGKEELAGRLANVGPVTPPEVNDRDEDGTADDEELSTAQRAVEAAEAKQREAQQKLADVTGDQLVTPSERQAVEEANKQVAEAKEAAETALANVPDGTPGKEELAGRLANVGPVTPPEVNDRDEDGTADDEELSTAQRAVEAAEAKQREAQQKLADVTGDQLVTPSERQAVEEANKQVAEAKEAAETALANVPDGTPGKEELAGRLANVGPVTPPEVNDRDEDGTADDEELSTAQRAVEAAEAKQREAQQKLADVTGDQLVTPSERQAVEEANKQVAEAKEAAETVLANVPDGTPGKGDLVQRLGQVETVRVPEVTDANSNGIADESEWESGLGLINEKPEFPAEELERLLQVERDKAADYIAGLPNLDASKVNEFKAAIQSAQTVPAIEEIIQAAETLNAKLAQTTPESGNGAGTTQPEKPEFEGGVNGQGLINEKPTFPAEELERLLQVERDKAADYIASLPNLDISKVNEFQAAIQKAQTVPVIEEIIQTAEALNTELGRGKVGGEQEQPAEPEAPAQSGQAESERPADKPTVTDHLQNAKTQAEATINSLSHLTRGQKDQFIASVHAATTVGQIHQIVEEARYMNGQQAIQESTKQANSGERLPETATGSWLLGLSGISSLLVGLGLKKKREDDDK
ncbi:GA-like domain-containing protein [Dolosigranulum pigrum]|uniref:GA-like domain-containing protein n=1 Tax=Dolosigranulum pigrum TaxID=29394 RepID=UPI001AD85C19|nr:YSIRK-type signal peptide-containing protein [Dolosigranulum pigrum]QTJ54398.1 YSIRK-type signal peptide-containing protein [Dolosigranulum pigrum]